MKTAGKIRAYFPREDFPPIYIALEKGWDPSIEELWPNFIEGNDPVVAAEIIVGMKEVTDPEEMWEWMIKHSAFSLKEAKAYLEIQLLGSKLPPRTCPRCGKEMLGTAIFFMVKIKLHEDHVHVCRQCHGEADQIRKEFTRKLEEALGEWYRGTE